MTATTTDRIAALFPRLVQYLPDPCGFNEKLPGYRGVWMEAQALAAEATAPRPMKLADLYHGEIALEHLAGWHRAGACTVNGE